MRGVLYIIETSKVANYINSCGRFSGSVSRVAKSAVFLLHCCCGLFLVSRLKRSLSPAFSMEGDPHRRGKPWKKCKWASFEWQFGWYCFADLAICQNIDHGLFCQVYSVNAYNGCWSFLKEDVNWSSKKSDIVNKSELGIKNCNVNAALLSHVDILHFKVKFLFL